MTVGFRPNLLPFDFHFAELFSNFVKPKPTQDL